MYDTKTQGKSSKVYTSWLKSRQMLAKVCVCVVYCKRKPPKEARMQQLINGIKQEEIDFPSRFASCVQKDWGVLFYMEDNTTFY